MVDGLCLQTDIHRDRHFRTLLHAPLSGLHIDRGLLHHARERTLGLFGFIALHILTQPLQGRTLLLVLDDARIAFAIVSPCLTVDPSPEGDTSTIVGLPQQGDLCLIVTQLVVIALRGDIVFGDVHRHLQGILNLLHRSLEGAGAAATQIVRLTTVGIDGCSSIANGLDEGDKLVRVPLECVVVVVDQNGIRPTLVSHLEGLDNPVVARLAIATQGSLIGGRGMTAHSLVHHVDHRKVGIVLLRLVHPLLDGFVLLLRREVVHPVRILRSPHEGVELEGESVLLGIVGSHVGSPPVVFATCTLHTLPFRGILVGHLVPVF